MIKVVNLKKTYLGKIPTPALKGVSFEVEKGEFIVIMGRSGSGKSTLLHQLGLIDTPTDGQIFIDGIHIQIFRPCEQCLDAVFIQFFDNLFFFINEFFSDSRLLF